jgi:hypothetical protein
MNGGSGRPPAHFTAGAIGLAAAIGLARWAFRTGEEVGPPYGIVILAAMWVYIEVVHASEGDDRPEATAIRSWHRVVLAAIALYVAVGSGLALAADLDVLGHESLPAARRFMGFTAGVMLALWGNFLPKLLSPWRTQDEPFDWQGVHRVVGWLASLAGVAVALVWVALPLDQATSTSKLLLGTVFGLAVLFKLYSLMTHNRGRDRPRPCP